MTVRKVLLALLATALLPAGVLALDPPHSTAQNYGCRDCHSLHNAPGAALTSYASNFNLCDSCHKNKSHFGFPWLSGDQATPGAGGRSHRWDADATSRGALPPTSAMSSALTTDGKIQCSSCHDQHNNGDASTGAPVHGGTQHIGGSTGVGTEEPTVGSAWVPNAGTGTGRMQLVTVTGTAASKAHRIKIVSADAANVYFKLSHDGGLSWYAWSGGWIADSGGTGAGKPAPAGSTAGVDLDDASNVQVAFPDAVATYAAGDSWDFWISYPFLRVSNAADAMCEDCHRARVQTTACVEGSAATSDGASVSCAPDGVRMFSHPVGVKLTKAYDRTVGANGPILDANGAAQPGGDTITSNDIHLDADGNVRCTSCHAIHNVDSNSLTVDAH